MAAKENKSPFSIDLLALSQEFNEFTGEGQFKSNNNTLILELVSKEILS